MVQWDICIRGAEQAGGKWDTESDWATPWGQAEATKKAAVTWKLTVLVSRWEHSPAASKTTGVARRQREGCSKSTEESDDLLLHSVPFGPCVRQHGQSN